MTRIKEVKNVIEYYDAEVALRICRHNEYYYLMYLQGPEGKDAKLYSCYSLAKLKGEIERYARAQMTTIFEKESDLAAWTVEWRIARIWDSVLSEIMNIIAIESFDEAMTELEKIKEIPGDPCTGPVYFGVE